MKSTIQRSKIVVVAKGWDALGLVAVGTVLLGKRLRYQKGRALSVRGKGTSGLKNRMYQGWLPNDDKAAEAFEGFLVHCFCCLAVGYFATHVLAWVLK